MINVNMINALEPMHWILIGIALLIVLMFIGGLKNKKTLAAQQEALKEIKVGDRVKTQIGVYGTIIKITDTTDGKVMLLETGEGNNKTTIECNFKLVTGIDNKCEMKIDEEGNCWHKIDGKWVNKTEEALREQEAAQAALDEEAQGGAHKLVADAMKEDGATEDIVKPKRTSKKK
ncbi:MAG: preprotein translocase subunit YajC [Firmicutes bacterium]|nr:preprotein translocase subunit YajC [Bacillota bacterium]